MAARSVQIYFCNLTNTQLVIKKSHLSHGVWSTEPPKTINAFTTNISFSSESDGFMTGTQGSVKFELVASDGELLTLKWDNPYGGTDAWSAIAPEGYQCLCLSNNGDNAVVYYVFWKTNAQNWMQENIETLGNLPLQQLCLPASHDAGMSVLASGTAFAANCNVITQVGGIASQLQAGARYFDIRPVISSGQYLTGHYGYIDSILGNQGGNGQSIQSIIADINSFTQTANELIILDLSHDYDTDVSSPYPSFNQDQWNTLMKQLCELNYLYIASNPATVDLTTLTLNEFTQSGTRPAVVVFLEPGDATITLGEYAQQGFYLPANLPYTGSYTETNDLQTMVSGQLGNMQSNSGYFQMSWTLTQDATEAATCALGTASSILDLAAICNPLVYANVLPACTATNFPRVLYTNVVNNPAIVALALSIIAKANP